MRVLLAIDGSESSDAAYRLVASLRWPEATVVQVVAVVEPMSSLLAGLSPYAIEGADERVMDRLLFDELRRSLGRQVDNVNSVFSENICIGFGARVTEDNHRTWICPQVIVVRNHAPHLPCPFQPRDHVAISLERGLAGADLRRECGGFLM